MIIPRIRQTALQASLALTQREPQVLLKNDRLLFLHCQETAVRTPDPHLANNVFLFAHRAILQECHSRGIVPLPSNETVFATLLREMLEQGPAWDETIAKRLASDQHDFHAVFASFSQRKPHPTLALHSALRMYRIFELLPQSS